MILMCCLLVVLVVLPVPALDLVDYSTLEHCPTGAAVLGLGLPATFFLDIISLKHTYTRYILIV